MASAAPKGSLALEIPESDTVSGISHASAEGSKALAEPEAAAIDPTNDLTGSWTSNNGSVFTFTGSGSSYTGELTSGNDCPGNPADIEVTGQGDGLFTGTTNLYTVPLGGGCGSHAGTVPVTIQVSSGGDGAVYAPQATCGNCYVQQWTRSSGGTTDPCASQLAAVKSAQNAEDALLPALKIAQDADGVVKQSLTTVNGAIATDQATIDDYGKLEKQETEYKTDVQDAADEVIDDLRDLQSLIVASGDPLSLKLTRAIQLQEKAQVDLEKAQAALQAGSYRQAAFYFVRVASELRDIYRLLIGPAEPFKVRELIQELGKDAAKVWAANIQLYLVSQQLESKSSDYNRAAGEINGLRNRKNLLQQDLVNADVLVAKVNSQIAAADQAFAAATAALQACRSPN